MLFIFQHLIQELGIWTTLNKIVDYMLSGKPILASYSGYQCD